MCERACVSVLACVCLCVGVHVCGSVAEGARAHVCLWLCWYVSVSVSVYVVCTGMVMCHFSIIIIILSI